MGTFKVGTAQVALQPRDEPRIVAAAGPVPELLAIRPPWSEVACGAPSLMRTGDEVLLNSCHSCKLVPAAVEIGDRRKARKNALGLDIKHLYSIWVGDCDRTVCGPEVNATRDRRRHLR